ncbi:nicotinate (nicotinamide) nucleotide adenylyltransferase [Deferribacter autotrophicus]|uniref:Probable nicotinate-nucleotide adenylyltransferase n=1 Tax=Deferribacter autotrophicus TaxID=500465 RepID=A0A5A8F791_9BACT|nr:nicotinate-nucleotide adenylyltransferase [Deferribacter autotrophicus]KAA0259453.1 nicotinate (nicotinamide) nucleotide adenylyltransferase [Deferribacter autotrophicus]
MRIVLFGGTFNPIHNGHIELAKKVYKDFNIDKFFFIPAKIPPHKNLGLVPAEKRFEMVKLALDFCLRGNFEVSDYELKQEGISFTYKTLKYFRKLYPDDILFFLTGSDIFATIETWQNWRELFKLSNFIVANRREMPFEKMMNIIPEELKSLVINFSDYVDQKEGAIILYKIDEIPISSTEIREKFKDKTIFSCLPNVVVDYIRKNKLYQEV